MAINTVGVVIFDDLKDGFTALKWARKEFVAKLRRPKLCIILIKEADVAQSTVIQQPLTGNSSRPQSLGNWSKIKEMFFPRGLQGGQQKQDRFDELARDFMNNIAGAMYEGPNIQDSLNSAMEKIKDLDMLIVGCAAGPNTTEGSKLPTELELSAGCKQIVLVEKIVSHPPIAPPAERERAASSVPSPLVISFMVVWICARATETGPATTSTVKFFQDDKLE